MKKINLSNKEKVIHIVKFSIRIFLIDLLLITLVLTLSTKLVAQLGNLGTFITFILMLLFIYLVIKTIFDIKRIFFDKAYITNIRLVYKKAYKIEDIIGVYFKSNRFDRYNNMSTFKIKMKDDEEVILKNVKFGPYIAELLSANLIKNHKLKQK